MNGYWDAILGAAMGLPGSARPGQGPRPLADLDDPGLPVEIEELHDSELPRAALPTPPQRAPAPPPAAVEAPAEPVTRATVPAATAAEPLRAAEPQVRRPAAEPEAAPSAPPIAPSAPDRPDDPGPRVREAPQPAAPEPIRAVFVRDAPLHVGESPSALVAAPALPSPPGDRTEAAGPPPPPAAEPVTVRAEPLAPPAPSVEREDERAEPPMLTIEIGRIDVRIDSPAAPPLPVVAKSAALPDSVPSLADYLARRGEAGR